MDSLGDRISKARVSKGMTQADVAKKMGYSVAMVSFWETGRSIPSDAQLGKLREILGKLASASAKETLSIQEWLRNLRTRRDFSMQELANHSGVSVGTINNIENGHTYPKQDTIDKLEKALNATIPEETAEDVEDNIPTPGVSDAKTFKPYDDTTWPNIGGVYVFYDSSDRPIYIGQSKNILRRIEQHAEKKWYVDPLVKFGKYIEIENEDLRRSVERALIRFMSSHLIVNRQLRTQIYNDEE